MKMQLSRGKHISSACPNTGRSVGHKWRHRWLRWLFLITGLLALIWFLVRVIPKPSRATYPCQRVAFPVASSFVVWLIGVIGSMVAFRKAKHCVVRSRYVVGAICIAVGIGAALMAISEGDEHRALAENPTPNDPIGVARGIHPGRVVWVHDPNATDWDGPDSGESCWEPGHTDQAVVDSMMSRSVRWLAGKSTDAEAWDALFRYFNRESGKGDTGYQLGEKIAIKVNLTSCNASNRPDKGTREKTSYLDKAADTSPQMILAVLRQLVNVVGVDQSDISVGDTVSYFPKQWYDHMAPEFPDVRYLDHYAFPGRTQVQHSTTPFYWSTADANGKVQDYLPVSFVEADYVINFAVLKGHAAGITVCAKNHYGSMIRNPVGYEWGEQKDYYNLHDSLPCDWASPGRGHYRALVDLIGHADLGGKTVLYLIDGLFGGYYWEGTPYKWNMSPFNGDWPSSLFASQDPVAIDSVAYDFLREEWPNVVEDGQGGPGSLEGGAEDYLHEAALANAPPSGTFYDPENDGSAMASLGVHEHWNNPVDKKYSRNLGTGDGIELISPDFYTPATVITGLGEMSAGYMEAFAPDYSHTDWLRVGWGGYNSANGEARVATGDIDGDGKDEIVLGLAPVAGDPVIPGGWFQVLDDDYKHLAWGRIQWEAYNSANGESWPACGDVDGDGEDEIIIGLGSYPSSGGWFQIFDYTSPNVTHKAWKRVNWGGYNSANGETRPACGDIDGDDRDEIVIGLGDGGEGYLEVFDDAIAGYGHLAWGQIDWGAYNTANGESWPACGDVDGDGKDEIIIGLGSYPSDGGWFQIFDYVSGDMTHKEWKRVNWGGYNSANGETRPACGDIDGDGRDEMVIGLGDGGEGYLEVFDDASAGYAHLAWPHVYWGVYCSANGETWPAVME